MRKSIRLTLASVALLLGVSPCAEAAVTLDLNPAGGSIAGVPGSTVGWGFTLANDTNYLVVTESQFCLSPVNTPLCTLSNIGTFSDIIGNAFIVVGPAGPPAFEQPAVTQPFNVNTPSGTGSFVIYGNALPGSVNAGEIVVHYDLYTRSPNDPSFNPTTDLISTQNFITAAAQVSVTNVPEPATLGLTGAAALLLVFRCRRDITE